MCTFRKYRTGFLRLENRGGVALARKCWSFWLVLRIKVLSEGIVNENLLKSYCTQGDVLRLKLKYVVKSLLFKVRERKRNLPFFLKEVKVWVRIWKIRPKERKWRWKSWSGYLVQRRKSKRREREMRCKQHRRECVLRPCVFVQERLETNTAKLNRHKQLRPKEKTCSHSHPLPSQGLPLTNYFLVSSVTSIF